VKASVGVNDLYEKYKDQYNFILVYIREAHPKDGWAFHDWSSIEDPKTFKERCATARMAVGQLKIPYDVVVDRMDDKVAVAYAGWPERLFVIGTDGLVKYAGAQGPWGFHPTKKYQHPMTLPGRRPKNLPEWIQAGPCLETWLEENN